MRKRLLLLGSCLFVLLAVPGSAAAATGSVSGTVTDSGTSEPVAEVKVCAWEFEHQFTPGGCEFTDAAGEYTIAGLEPGAYMVEFAQWHEFGYDVRFFNEQASSTNAEEVVVASAATTSGIDAALIPGGAIEGTVTSSKTLEPLFEAQVCAQDLADSTDIVCVFTDAEGHYVVPGLGTSSYKVRFLYERKEKESHPVIKNVSPVSVTAPNTTTGVNCALAV
jgi:hypothetical protein